MNSLTKKFNKLNCSKPGENPGKKTDQTIEKKLQENTPSSCGLQDANLTEPTAPKVRNDRDWERSKNKRNQKRLKHRYKFMHKLIKRSKATSVDQLLANLSEYSQCEMHAMCGKDWFTIASNLLQN